MCVWIFQNSFVIQVNKNHNIHKKKKAGKKMRKKGAKGAPTAAAIKRSQA